MQFRQFSLLKLQNAIGQGEPKEWKTNKLFFFAITLKMVLQVSGNMMYIPS